MAATMLRAAGLAPAAIARNLSNSTRSSERMLMELLCLDSKSGAGKLAFTDSICASALCLDSKSGAGKLGRLKTLV